MRSFPNGGSLVYQLLHIRFLPRPYNSTPTNFDGNQKPKLDYFPPFAPYFGKCTLARNS
jgi:hypothetical protein